MSSTYPIILVVIVVQMAMNLATLAWVAILKRRVHAAAASPSAPSAPVRKPLLDPEKVVTPELIAEVRQAFQRELEASAKAVGKQAETASYKLLEVELEELHTSLNQLRATTKTTVDTLSKEIDQQKTTIDAQVRESVETEKKALLAKLDAKFADVITAFLIESLGNDIDLGAQSAYIFKMLEASKADILKDLSQ